MPIRPKHARHFSKRSCPVLQIAQPKRDGDAVKRSIVKWQIHCVGKHHLVHAFSLRKVQHFVQEIDTDDVRVRQFLLQSERQISGAGSEIRDLVWVPTSDDFR